MEMSHHYFIITTTMENSTDKILKRGLDVHEFGQAIQDNKHLYSEEEFMFLCGQWVKDYEQYLINLVKHSKGKS